MRILVDDIVLGSHDSLHSTGFFCTVHCMNHHNLSMFHPVIITNCNILYTVLIEFLVVCSVCVCVCMCVCVCVCVCACVCVRVFLCVRGMEASHVVAEGAWTPDS